METRQQYKLDGLTRGQDFLDAPEAGLGSLRDTDARRLLDASVEQVQMHRQAQRDAENERRAAMARKVAAGRELRERHMKPIAKFARAKLVGAPDFAALSVSGRGLRVSELVTAARATAQASAAVVDVLVEAQFPVDVVAQLEEAADALAKAQTDHAATKVAIGVATASIRQNLSEGRRALSMLDAVVMRKLAGNAGLLEGWRQSKRVVKKPGVVAGSDGAVTAPSPSGATGLTTS